MKTCDELQISGTVAIVGAGPAGLTLARLLQMRGFSVRVFERDDSPTSRMQGGSLDLRPNSGQRAIRQAGLGHAFEQASRSEAKSFKMLDWQGEVRTEVEAESQEDNGPEIDRGELRRLLLDSVSPGTITWGHVAKDVLPETGGRWRLEFKEQASVTADLIVGADGIGSRVRPYLTPIRPQYFGLTMLAAVIRKELWRDSELSELLGEGSMLVSGGGQTIWVQRCAHDLIRLYFSMAIAEDWPKSQGFTLDDTKAVLKFVTAAYHDWSPNLITMMTQVEGSFERWPLYVMPPDHRWTTQPGLTMVGDASHVMPPFTGKGVNLALLDALELADSLMVDPAASVTAAVETFETRMQERTQQEISECLDRGREIYGIDIHFDRQPSA
ncbi:FAD-dependent oxidoreductase [Nostoc sp. 'Lobaria pulmonaria (5183) cyanobiont']|uniref:FAD-dependent oxidoreductase n=1 Tax=Nostoc sp. 'Lobaria pulmonaria (5183) cyanobiont' TaxID=1618022 RepID=UPI000CF310AE|nr:NAD(P)/FAD-dependent oxidoreductase [Nostoc sp. 'Lobaria pulmonaria (5183) cyanobiont']AVH73275.1 FAD-binding monooxygenase [Nostoc sp. 'Lobaria pulmonaria (5183) cyanobiont']